MRTMLHALTAALALFFAAPAFADGTGDAGPDVAAPPVRAAPVQPAPATTQTAPPEGRTGTIPVSDGLNLNVPQGYRFYSAEEAYAYLQRNNATAPSGTVVGLLARADADIRAPDTWATVISYDAIGYVQPETAAGLSDASFEADVRSAREEQNRVFEGFADAPAFTTETPSLNWAERIAAPGSQGKDLRYEQKVLGRYGVAGLTSIGTADQMPEITAAASEMAGMLSFTEGSRHSDFEPANDQVSAYSVPGLVTGIAQSDAQALAEPAANGEGQTAFGGLAGWFPWVALGVIALAIGGFMMMRRKRDDEFADDEA